MPTTPKLATIHRRLLEHHGEPALPPVEDPFELVLWEQVAYLASDARRAEAFQCLARTVGLKPRDILTAPLEVLTEIASSGGGIAADKRAARMRESAQRVVNDWNGDLRNATSLPLEQAVKALAKFPMIGKPGAEKILLLSAAAPVLALDSNGLRVLLRLGYGTESDRYEKSYASVRRATASQVRASAEGLAALHGLLRRHGQETCRNTRPDCGNCALRRQCAYHASNAAE